jgi:Multicopper oxidase/TAT (twin-arginine translocation) pathway signal sequence
MKRRDFLKSTGAGIAALVVGGAIPSILENEAYAAVAVQNLNFLITDANKGMATDEPGNPQANAQCYFWIYKDNGPSNLPPDCPGPHIFATAGGTIKIKLTNQLDEPHGFCVSASAAAAPFFQTGPIAPGVTKTFTFTAPPAGTYLYYDNLNAPVNRVMGLHGAFISMPVRRTSKAGQKRVSPYDGRANIPATVQRLFNDLGKAAWWPGLAWEQGDTVTSTPPFRQYIWLLHQASPNLFAEVGSFTAGQIYPSAQFIQKFLHDPFSATGNNNVPKYFTISGQSGHFSHNTPYICPNNRVGEPVLIRILNAGLWHHSMHIHANHVFVTAVNGQVRANPFWVDVYTLNSMDIVDWLVPYMRPPDVPNARGIGRADTPLQTNNFGPTWPPVEELNIRLPSNLTAGAIDLSVQLSPLCYPMHDHSEPSQTSQGGNYNMGMISGLNFTGDRNHFGGVVDFPNQPLIHGPGPADGLAPPAVPPPWFKA